MRPNFIKVSYALAGTSQAPRAHRTLINLSSPKTRTQIRKTQAARI